jgi:enolase
MAVRASNSDISGEVRQVLRFSRVDAREVLDTRGNPTLSVTVELDNGTTATAGVPSGASTGSREAVELRDGDQGRFGGRGVLKAVGNVTGDIADLLRSRSFADVADVDAALIALDGTENKSRLGANAIVGVSMAVARAAALNAEIPLWRHLTPDGVAARLPWPSFNIVNGGRHAGTTLAFQEFMVTPLGAPTMTEALRAGAEVYAVLRARLAAGGHATGLGDEGGFAPALTRPEEALELIVTAIADAGYAAGRDGVAIALDPAASEFFRDGAYHVGGQAYSSGDMISWYAELIDRFPIWSIEDGLAEGDWDNWAKLTATIGDRVQVVGDDILVTNPGIIARAIGDGIANAALIKVNQIGTVTETLEAMRLCRDAGWGQMVSHRSGESGDSFIADLAVGAAANIKAGAPAQARIAIYNRLTDIEGHATDLSYGPG